MPSLDSLPIHRLPLVFDGADCLAVGISRHQLTRLVASPVVETVGPRLYAEAVRWVLADRVERHRALARHAPGRFAGTALSHESAAVWHGLPHPRRLPSRVMLTHDPRVRSCDDSDWVGLHRAGLTSRRVEVVDGVQVTTPARTAVDCLRRLPLADGLAVADAVVARGTTPGELVEVRKEQHRWPRSRRARLGIGLVDGRRESWLESASAAGLHGWLPRPVAQVDVLDLAGSFVARADMLWPDLRAVGEADGREKFLGMPGADTSDRAVAERLVAAAERARDLESLGLAVVRWGAAALSHPAGLAGRIRGARPAGDLRAVLLCSRCREEVAGCRCAPRLFLAPHWAST